MHSKLPVALKAAAAANPALLSNPQVLVSAQNLTGLVWAHHLSPAQQQERERLELELKPTADVLRGLGAQRREGQTLVGFAAEHGADAVKIARGKLTGKGLDALVVNDISRSDIGFEVEANEVTILSVAGEGEIERREVPRAAKAEVAEAILDAVQGLRARG